MHFETNMGTVDRAVRIVVALVLGYAYFTGMVTGWVGIVSAVIAGVFIVTSLMSSCPLYTLLGVKTCSTR